jgi:hypothetical protein
VTEMPPLFQPAAKETWLITVGISSYRSASLPRLNYAEVDTLRVESFFKGKACRVSRLFGSKASGQAIFAALDDVAKQATPESMFIFHFSGHGYNFKGEQYIYPPLTFNSKTSPYQIMFASELREL